MADHAGDGGGGLTEAAVAAAVVAAAVAPGELYLPGLSSMAGC